MDSYKNWQSWKHSYSNQVKELSNGVIMLRIYMEKWVYKQSVCKK